MDGQQGRLRVFLDHVALVHGQRANTPAYGSRQRTVADLKGRAVHGRGVGLHGPLEGRRFRGRGLVGFPADITVLDERRIAAHVVAGLGQLGAGLGQQGFLFAQLRHKGTIVQTDQGLSFADVLPFGEMDLDDFPGHARHDPHRSGRLDVAHNLQHARGIRPHGLLHAHPRGLRLSRSLLVVGTCRQTQGQQHARQKADATCLFSHEIPAFFLPQTYAREAVKSAASRAFPAVSRQLPARRPGDGAERPPSAFQMRMIPKKTALLLTLRPREST